MAFSAAERLLFGRTRSTRGRQGDDHATDYPQVDLGRIAQRDLELVAEDRRCERTRKHPQRGADREVAQRNPDRPRDDPLDREGRERDEAQGRERHQAPPPQHVEHAVEPWAREPAYRAAIHPRAKPIGEER